MRPPVLPLYIDPLLSHCLFFSLTHSFEIYEAIQLDFWSFVISPRLRSILFRRQLELLHVFLLSTLPRFNQKTLLHKVYATHFTGTPSPPN